MSITRRNLLKVTAALGTAGAHQHTLAATLDEHVPLSRGVKTGLSESDLVYLSPLKSNGKEGSCQAEIWFVYDGANIFVCTDTVSWRAEAVRTGLTTTKFWVGDLGQWKKTDGKYRALPSLLAKATVETDETEQQRVLELFGEKYRLGWLFWGPKFRKGLGNGERTLLKYRAIA